MSTTPFSYSVQHAQYDEVLRPDGKVRDHWHYPMQVLQAMGPDALLERQRTAKRILRDDGASYSPGDQLNISHTWNLDLVPMILSSAEWSTIENALRERAELLNLILADLYGPRTLIFNRVIPPSLIFGNPEFLRACDGMKLQGDHQLIFHAADLIRDKSGEWMIIGDRSQAPSGTGYVLENRTVLRRVMPSLFRDAHVHRLANFFLQWRRKLTALAGGKDSPLIVYLTRGAYQENSFEDAYLANYLGYPLVQSRDLTVRKGGLWLKSLDGLRRVDVVLRRIDDCFTDPVVSRYSAGQGVPGLLEVARNGGVVIANPIGSGILENPAFAKYMPAIARHFLGRELRMNSVPTWWCGDREDLAYVRAHFDDLLIRHCSRLAGGHSVFVNELDKAAREKLLHSVLADPESYVAQQVIPPSQTPVLEGKQLSSRPLVLRGYAVASDASYSVMPGGLTHVGANADTRHIVSQYGGGSKDTWILASEPEAQVSIYESEQSRGADRSFSLPSRIIDNLFWFGRYAERAESGLRLVRTVFEELNSIEPLPRDMRCRLLESVTHVTATYPGFVAADANIDSPEQELLDVVANRGRFGCIAHCLEAILHSADGVKELLSNDMLRLINDVRDGMDYLNAHLAEKLQSAPEELFDPLITTLLALCGLSQESMVRSRAWRFMEMGRRLERAQQTIELLRHTLVEGGVESGPVSLLKPVLASLESRIVYKRYYRSGYRLEKGLELLLFDRENPRSLAFQLESLRIHLEELNGPRKSVQVGEDLRCLLKANNALLLARLPELASTDLESGTCLKLDSFLEELETDLKAAAQAIADRYFDHTAGPQTVDMGGRNLS